MQAASSCFAITPHNDNDLPAVTRGIYIAPVDPATDLAVILVDGTTATFFGLAGGVIHPMQVKRVLVTGTTATGIIGLI